MKYLYISSIGIPIIFLNEFQNSQTSVEFQNYPLDIFFYREKPETFWKGLGKLFSFKRFSVYDIILKSYFKKCTLGFYVTLSHFDEVYHCSAGVPSRTYVISQKSKDLDIYFCQVGQTFEDRGVLYDS